MVPVHVVDEYYDCDEKDQTNERGSEDYDFTMLELFIQIPAGWETR